MKDAVRFPKLKTKTLTGKIAEYQENWRRADKAVTEGKVICISDLIGQAEEIT